MLDLNDVYFFVQVVDHQGFSAAGRALNLPKSRLSRRIGELEKALEARLLHRSSRRLAMTDAGQEFYRHAQAILVEAEAAETAVRNRLGEPVGTVRLACSVAMAQFVTASVLPWFLQAYPRVQVVQQASNRYVDPVGEGFDLVLRAHQDPLPDSSLIQRPLAKIQWWLVASPTYIETNGEPIQPDDLKDHQGLMLGSEAGEGRWRLTSFAAGSDKSQIISFRPRYCSDDMTSLKSAAIAGLGVLALPHYICTLDLAEKRLVRVLPHWHAGEPQLSLIMPSRRGRLPAVKALAEFLSEEIAGLVQLV